mgnify:CR=1
MPKPKRRPALLSEEALDLSTHSARGKLGAAALHRKYPGKAKTWGRKGALTRWGKRKKAKAA